MDVHEAFLKALVSTGFKLPQKSIALTIPRDLLEEVVHHVWILHEMVRSKQYENSAVNILVVTEDM